MKSAHKLALLGLPLALVACSVLEPEKVDYKAATKATPLSVPPDLTQLPRDTRYATPGAPVSATGFESASQAGANNVIAPAYPGMRIEAQGLDRWLIVELPPEKLWPVLKEFWQQTGFTLTRDDIKLGVMETDWNENRAKLPQDFLGRTLGKLLDSMASTGELDMYRTRLERNQTGASEIYITHRGMMEVYRDDGRTRTIWQQRPTEHDLEYEMLRRLMTKLGMAKAQAEQQIAAAQPRQSARLDTREGKPVVIVSEGFDRAWRRLGLTLDRTGFSVEDRDRSQGAYFVRYVEPTPPGQEEPGFWSKLFSTPKDKTPQKYRITVRTSGEETVVAVLNAEGESEPSDNAQRILKVIADDLH